MIGRPFPVLLHSFTPIVEHSIYLARVFPKIKLSSLYVITHFVSEINVTVHTRIFNYNILATTVTTLNERWHGYLFKNWPIFVTSDLSECQRSSLGPPKQIKHIHLNIRIVFEHFPVRELNNISRN